jgi:iron complex outermembrane receptor protein
MSELFRKKPLAAAAVLVPALLGASVAQAALEEIVVTAQKKSENLQEVPISITAVTADGLDKAGIVGSDELSVVVPNLQFGRQLNSATPFMRGVGTKNSSVGDEGSISTYVDGVYYSSMVASIMEFNNIERIEVLRGPQGTLFGRNATGGLIHVITKDPSHETSGKIKAGIANYDTHEVGFYGTTGLTESIAADLAIVQKRREDGYGDNLFTGKDRHGEDQLSIRTKFLIDISDETQLTLAYLHAKSDGDLGLARQQAPGVLGAGGAVNTGDFQDINANNVPRYNTEQDSYSAKLVHDFDSFELISTTAYYETEYLFRLDQESGPAEFFNFNLDPEEDQFSQEIQLNSTTDSAFQWTAGLYYMTSEASYLGSSHISHPLAGTLPVLVTQETTSYAIYGQGSYDFTDATKLTLGLRWTRDERELKDESAGGRPTQDESWEEPTWRVALDHQLNEDVLLYASYSRGFKSGVYNTVVANPFPFTEFFVGPVDPEILDAYEIGFKGDFLDSSLRLNVSAFYYEVDDLQYQLIQGGAITLLNVGETEIKGAEIESTYFVTDNLDINFSFAYLDGEYSSFDQGPVLTPNPAGGNIGTFADLGGNDLVRAPDYTYSLAANYRVPLDIGELNFNVTYYYNDGFYWEPDNRLEQDDYTVLNAEVGLETGSWFFRVWGRNLQDEEYSYYAQESSTGDLVSAAPPRTYGASAEYRF